MTPSAAAMCGRRVLPQTRRHLFPDSPPFAVHIQNFRDGDEAALRTIFHLSVHELTCKRPTVSTSSSSRGVCESRRGKGAHGAYSSSCWQPWRRRLFADVSLTAEPFFRRSGFVVEMRQLVEVKRVVLANARMCKELPALDSLFNSRLRR